MGLKVTCIEHTLSLPEPVGWPKRCEVCDQLVAPRWWWKMQRELEEAQMLVTEAQEASDAT